MTYTIKINQTGPQAQGIIDMLKALAKDYDFLQIYEEPDADSPDSLTSEQEKELDSRIDYVMKNPTDGKSWEEVEKDLLTL